MQPLIIAQDVKKIGEFINQLPVQRQKNILKRIIDNENGINAQEKIELVLYFALQMPDANYQSELFNLIPESMIKQMPVLYAAAAGYEKSIPLVLQWLNDPQKQNEWIKDAADYAIAHNKSGLIKNIIKYIKNVPNATNLLWHVVNKQLDASLVKELVNKGANPNDAQAGKTLLVAAVETNKADMVKALLDAGAQINAIADPAIGSALQMAIKKGYTPIELMLRKRGARE